MKQLLLFLLSLFALWACNPTIENPTHEDTPPPELPQRPESAISTLTDDLELVFSADNTLVYADCYGDYYKTGLYMWQFYFMEFTSKEMLCIEVMVEPNDLVVPTGTFAATSNIFQAGGMLRGIIDEEGYNAYSWYTRTNSAGQILDRAPIAEGSVIITANDDGTHTATFALQDDALNTITGGYTGVFMVEDFR
ncbi:MAG: hypothetical protein II358_03750 [Tidjanibacter sp.]|nr:hypothetical protein [Tidjanibacter sp.]